MENSSVYINRDITDEEYRWITESCSYIGVDTETTGLDPIKDKLCLIQIAAKDKYFIIRYDKSTQYDNIEKLFLSKSIIKVFHHAVFDVRFLINNLKVKKITKVVCTKIAFKILYGLNEKSSLKYLLLKYLNVNVSKEQQVSDWTRDKLSNEQLEYASNDVKYLVKLWEALEQELNIHELLEYAQKCFGFISTQAYLNNRGIKNIFEY
jgi:ribonuclease D